MTPFPLTPADLLARAALHRADALRDEAEALRAALDATGWQVRPAARILGRPHMSVVRILGRHPEILAKYQEFQAVRAVVPEGIQARTEVRNGKSAKPREMGSKGANDRTHARTRKRPKSA